MAVTKTRIQGTDVTLTCGGSVTKWRTVTFEIVESAADAQASDEEELSDTQTGRGITGKIEGFMGVVNHGATLPLPGDVIDDLDATVEGTSILPDLSSYSNIRFVAPLTITGGKDPWTYASNFKSGRLNAL